MTTESREETPNFIRDIIAADVSAGKHGGRVQTRFPPEPNGYLHIGHAYSICLNFGMAELYGGKCNLRFDDTNPTTEDAEFVRAIERDVAWLGFEWGESLFASDYFEQLWAWALGLIEAGLAYVDEQTPDEIREARGDFHRPGTNSPFRERSVEENLEAFKKMRAGGYDEGAAVLRAKIDMASPNLNMRDPLMYRVVKASHHRQGDAWCVYPMYDFAHGQEDAIEKVTHSLCSLEFQDHRPLYDWYLEKIGIEEPPQQIEFGRLNLTYTILSKRHLLALVTKGHVEGWDDPRMPTVAGLRRRGYPAEAIRNFCGRIAVSKRDGVVDVGMLEYEVRETLNRTSPRVMGVLRPLKLTITNIDPDQVEVFDAPYSPNDESMGSRPIYLTREVWVEHDDFRMEAPRKWHRLAPGKEVRLRYACLVTCQEVVTNAEGEVVELKCTWDPESRGGSAPDGRKVRGTLHWVSASKAIDATVRVYDRLFSVDNPGGAEGGFEAHLNGDSLETIEGAKLEPSLADARVGHQVQFERLGYFVLDADSSDGRQIWNRTIALRDSWAKLEKKLAKG